MPFAKLLMHFLQSRQKKYGDTILNLISNYFKTIPGFVCNNEDDEFSGMDDLLLQSLSAHKSLSDNQAAVSLHHDENQHAAKRRKLIAGSSPSDDVSSVDSCWDNDG